MTVTILNQENAQMRVTAVKYHAIKNSESALAMVM